MKSYLILTAILIGMIACKKEMVPQKPIGPVGFELIWEHRLTNKNEKIFAYHPALTQDGGLVFEKTFAGPDDLVTCLDRKTGNVRWTSRKRLSEPMRPMEHE